MLFLSTLAALAAAAAAYQTCVVPHGGAGIDDTIALNQTIANCSSDSQILFQEGTTYNIGSPVTFRNLTNIEIAIRGNLALPTSIPYVQAFVNASAGQRLDWFTISGHNVTLTGNQNNPDGGYIDPFGEPWWIASQLTEPGGLALRPHFMGFSANNSEVAYLKIRKPIGWVFSMSGSNLHIHDVDIDASYDLNNPSLFPFNTDGYDVSGVNILMENNHIFNGDDCVAVNNGAHNVTIRNMICEGGHGASLSGTDNIANIHFDNITSRNSLYATRFKSSLNSTGNVYNVTWSNIYVLNATFPIFATSAYFDQNTNRGLTPGNFGAGTKATNITNFSWINVTGTINDMYPGDGSCITVPCWYSIPGITNTPGIPFQMLPGSAQGIQVKNVNLLPIDGKGAPNTFCNSTYFSDGTANLVFECTNGPYVATSS
ncbi:glycoside hydrolase family 28 protein [Calocera cornea HHB12733]|uniref:galacturonan 1,4-alpha-galacturonidase n=1 Tax=Calocera cornea HHB12733 TaxID=1353952 RepID=A0A165GKA3_9BASI|nr:glycoside hydrolase family 28 protein [Calocera cornea HHB12733]